MRHPTAAGPTRCPRDAFHNRDDVDIVAHPGADRGFSHRSGPTWDAVATDAILASARRMLAAVG